LNHLFGIASDIAAIRSHQLQVASNKEVGCLNRETLEFIMIGTVVATKKLSSRKFNIVEPRFYDLVGLIERAANAESHGRSIHGRGGDRIGGLVGLKDWGQTEVTRLRGFIGLVELAPVPIL